jgi:hypothetical protein
MSVPVAALFAAAIYQVRSSLPDAEELDRSAGLLIRATDGTAVSFEVCGDDLRINGTPLSLEAPGTAVIRHALVDHHTARLALPGGLVARQWREVVELYASAPGLYASVDDLRDALRFTVPDAVVSGSGGAAAEGDLRQSLFELPGLRAGTTGLDATRALDPHNPALVDLTAKLDPLLQALERARGRADYHELAQTLLKIHDLAQDKDADLRAIVVRERRRIVPPEVLDSMARLIPKATTPAIISRVLGTLGHDGADALIGALNGAHGPHERRAYIDALVACRECDEKIVDALGNERAELVRDAAEVVGRKRMVHAVPLLSHLLRHAKVDVRTTAWHALEMIGTPEAMRALRK